MTASTFDPNTILKIGGAGGLLSGLLGNSGAPYQNAMNQYKEFANKATETQQPFLQAGQSAIAPFQSWLNSMSNPSSYINNLMGEYKESPWAKYQQQQSIRAAQNAASAGGLTGSTPLALQMQQNSSNIAGQDMNQWLQNVLGINTQFGGGLSNLLGYGANAANALTGMYGDMGRQMGAAAYGQGAGENQDLFSTLLGGASLLGGFGFF